jgi:hypothetical protein
VIFCGQTIDVREMQKPGSPGLLIIWILLMNCFCRIVSAAICASAHA